jgi:ketosteroid isomerase-like protein
MTLEDGDTARAMSQENLRLAGELVDAVARQDLPRLIELTDPEVEWQSFMAHLGQHGAYRGHDGMRQYVRDIGDAWEFLHAELDQAISVGEVVLLVGQLRYRGRGSGAETTSAAGYVVRFREGRVVLMRALRDPERALGAVGLSE